VLRPQGHTGDRKLDKCRCQVDLKSLGGTDADAEWVAAGTDRRALGLSRELGARYAHP
jgi:hypothetical protein